MRISRDDLVNLDDYFVDSDGEQEIISKYREQFKGEIDDEEYSYRKNLLGDDMSAFEPEEEGPIEDEDIPSEYEEIE